MADILVAANQENKWPISQNEVWHTYYLEFNAGEIKDFFLDVFGEVKVDVITQPSKVSLCPNPDFPINAPYDFEVLVSSDVEPCPTCGPFGNNSGLAVNSKTSEAIRVQSPFSEYLTLFFEEEGFLSGIRSVTLRNLNGRIVFFEKIDLAEPVLSLMINDIPSGVYFMEIISGGANQNVKLIKW